MYILYSVRRIPLTSYESQSNKTQLIACIIAGKTRVERLEQAAHVERTAHVEQAERAKRNAPIAHYPTVDRKLTAR